MTKLEGLLKDMPGVDYEGAVKRMSDNAAFYAKLLRLFFADNPLDRLVAALESEDMVKAIYEAHSMKGTAANLGLIRISQTAAQIMVHLKCNETIQAKAMLEELKLENHKVSSLVGQWNGGPDNEVV